MTVEGTILDFAKFIARDLERGKSSRYAMEVAGMLAGSGVLPDIVACLISEAIKKRRAGGIIDACCYLLQAGLSELRIAGNGGSTDARARLAEVTQAVERAVSAPNLAPQVSVMIALAFAQAGLQPPQALQDAMIAGLEAGLIDESGTAVDTSLLEHLVPLAEGLGHDSFAIHAELSATGAAFPADHRAAMAAELATSSTASLRDAALGFLLDPDPAPGIAVLATLVAQARQQPAPSRLIERLVCLRPWLPPQRQTKLDATIRSLRANAAAPEPAPQVEIIKLLASLCDGAGAQSLFAILKIGRRFALSSVLIKADTGIADAWLRDGMTKREANDAVREISDMVEAAAVPISFTQTLLADALAINLTNQSLPPFALLQFTEALGLGLILPKAIPPATLAAQLLESLPADQTGPEALAEAHAAAKYWFVQFDTVQTWFEAGEEIDALLKPIPKTGPRVLSALFTYVFDRRLFWAARCGWMAATLKDSNHRCRAEWRNFALVARDLAGTEQLPDNTLLHMIADGTHQAFKANAPKRRQAGRKRR
ncbi:MAG: hypothetical protein ING02_09270 [Roseomonas sp.]|nr:hypothetical protein [Roseomonas sp.]